MAEDIPVGQLIRCDPGCGTVIYSVSLDGQMVKILCKTCSRSHYITVRLAKFLPSPPKREKT